LVTTLKVKGFSGRAETVDGELPQSPVSAHTISSAGLAVGDAEGVGAGVGEAIGADLGAPLCALAMNGNAQLAKIAQFMIDIR
jgi:hypothetical protein